MKKVLIPILSMAAVAPIATTTVACSSKTINLKFLNNDYGFVSDYFDVIAKKTYKFAVNMADASEKWLSEEVDKFTFCVAPLDETSNEEIFAKLDKDSLEVKINDKVLGKDQIIFDDAGSGWFDVDLGDDYLKNTDKVYIKLAFLEDILKVKAVLGKK